MKLRSGLFVFTLLALPLLGATPPLPAAPKASHDPDIRSAAALVLDEKEQRVLFARRADIQAPIASITKLMTAMVVIEARQPLDERIRIDTTDVSKGKGIYSRLPVGATLTRGELLHLALMASENRAAHALGRSHPGGEPAFVRAMNRKARELGMKRTRFVEPTGLSSENVSTPQDLAKLVIAASHDPTIRTYSTDPEHAVPVGRRLVEFHNTNSLVRNPAWNIALQKTGYIAEAGRCLVMQAVIEGRSVVIVLLNSFGKYTRVADAKRVRDWMEQQISERS